MKNQQVGSVLTSIFLIVGVGFIFPALILMNEKSPNWDLSSISALFLLELSVLVLTKMVLSQRMLPLKLTFWVFVLFWFGLSGFAQSLSNRFYWAGEYTVTEKFQGIVIIFVGIVAYQFGRNLYIIFARRKHKTIPQWHNLVSFSQIRFLILFTLIASCTVVLILGNIRLFFGGRQLASSYFYHYGKAGGLFIKSILQVPPFITLLLLLFLFRSKKKSNHRINIPIFLSLLLLLGINFITNFPTYLSRYWLGTIVVSILFVILKRSRKNVSVWILVWILSLGIIYPSIARVRYILSPKELPSAIQFAFVDQFYSGDFDAYQQLLNGITFVRSNGPVYGENLLGSFLFWVPRSFWVNKPFGSGAVVTEYLGYNFTNLSFSLWAEGYYAFGYFGVVLLLLIYGYWSAYLDTVYYTKYTSDQFIFLIVSFWMPYQIFFLRGDLMNAIAFAAPVFILLWFDFRILNVFFPKNTDRESMKNNNILFIGTFPPPIHGMSFINQAILTRLQSEGISIQQLNTSPPQKLLFFSRLFRIKSIFRVWLKLLSSPLSKNIIYIALSGGLGQIYDIVTISLCRIKRVGIVFHHHSTAYLLKKQVLTSILFKIAGSNVSHVVLCKHMKNKLQELYGSENIIILSNVNFLERANRSGQQSDDFKIIGYLSNITKGKGGWEILKLAEEIMQKEIQLKLLVAGPCQDSKLVAALKEAENRGELTWLGPLYGEEKEKFYNKIDVFLFPTSYKNEAEPIVVWEALLAGAPVIAFDRGCISSQIQDAGVVIPKEKKFASVCINVIEEWIEHPKVFNSFQKATYHLHEAVQANGSEQWKEFISIFNIED